MKKVHALWVLACLLAASDCIRTLILFGFVSVLFGR